MGHRVTFENFNIMRGLLTEQEAKDLIDVLYRWSDAKFRIVAIPNDRKIRGDYRFMFNENSHVIRLAREQIKKGFEDRSRCGGNTAAPSLRMAAAMVLAHELQHANQHASPAKLAKHREYLRRGNERDARASVDNNLSVIASVLGEPTPSVIRARPGPSQGDHGDEIGSVAELFHELSEVSVGDIVEELRSSGINNAKNVGKVVELLTGRGIQVKVA